MEINRKLYNEVIKYITNNEKMLRDLTKGQALNKLVKVFKPDYAGNNFRTIEKAYSKWRTFYMVKSEPTKPKTETMSFRVTEEEKKEIILLLDGRKIRDILLEVLRNE